MLNLQDGERGGAERDVMLLLHLHALFRHPPRGRLEVDLVKRYVERLAGAVAVRIRNSNASADELSACAARSRWTNSGTSA